MARTDTLNHFLTDVADAIRTKTGGSAQIVAEDFDTEIGNIPSGGESEYFNTTISDSTYENLFKKMPAITIANSVTSLSNFANGWKGTIFSKVTFDSNITMIDGMFGSCWNLVSLDVSGFNTSNVTTMQNLFTNCAKLANLDLTTFDTSKVSNMQGMFNGCGELTNLNLSNFNTANVTNMFSMFNGCKKLANLDIRNFNFANVNNSTYMFGSSASQGVPDDCEIIVKGDTEKSWITTNFSRLTNVKTVAEYEAEQNA